jgi:hypothetical protein
MFSVPRRGRTQRLKSIRFDIHKSCLVLCHAEITFPNLQKVTTEGFLFADSSSGGRTQCASCSAKPGGDLVWLAQKAG